MWKKGIAVALVTTGLLGSAFAFAGEGQGPGPGHNPLAWVVDQLDLTDAQEAMVEEWRAEARAEREEFRADREATKDALKSELLSGDPDPKVFHRMVDDRVAAHKARMHEQIDRFFELYDTFKPYQKAELARIVEEGPPEGARPDRWSR